MINNCTNMNHIMIVGRNGVGKSTLIRALCAAIPAPIYGVITKKEPPVPDGFCPVYIHTFGMPRSYSDENCIGRCKDGCSVACPQAFDRFAKSMSFPHDGVILFDELGFLESSASQFTDSVLHILDEAPLVICAVRDKHTPFLDAVRTHPRASVYHIDEQNRDALREQLLSELPALLPPFFAHI